MALATDGKKKRVSKKSIDNLSKPGHTNNPNGRPKGSSYKGMVQDMFVTMMDSNIKYKKQDTTFMNAYIESFKESALNGGWASRVLAERLFSDNILDDLDKQLNKTKREDADFLSYRIYKRGHDIQQRILLSKQKYVYCMAGRRSGKTDCNKLLIEEQCLATKESRVLIIGLSFTRCLELYWNDLIKDFNDMGIDIKEQKRSEGTIRLFNDSEIHFVGNTTVDERDKLRGSKWHLVVVDEVQSQKALPILINEILEPTLLDYKGRLILTGTGPKVRGTYWEVLWIDDKKPAAKFNWNLKDNPFIPDCDKVLEEIKKEKGLTDKSPLFLREYLGQISYDDDALVYRITPNNKTNIDIMTNWINSQPVSDIKFTAGLDYGFSDSDAFVIIMFSTSKKERFLVYEHKGNRKGITELADKVKDGINYINTNNLFKCIPDKQFYIFSDAGGGGKKISYELSTQFGLPCLDAYKVEKNVAVEQLQEEVRTGNFKIFDNSVFEDECLKTVFSRNEKDELTRIIDDDIFHPDLLDAILYAMRYVWINYNNNL